MDLVRECLIAIQRLENSERVNNMARPRKNTTKETKETRNTRSTGNRSRNKDGNRERNPNRIGALWLKHKNGKTFMSGEIEIPEDYDLSDGRVRILVFKNSYKEQDNHPDYNIMLPRDAQRSSGNTRNDDDIPF